MGVMAELGGALDTMAEKSSTRKSRAVSLHSAGTALQLGAWAAAQLKESANQLYRYASRCNF